MALHTITDFEVGGVTGEHGVEPHKETCCVQAIGENILDARDWMAILHDLDAAGWVIVRRRWWHRLAEWWG